ncbi:MAG: OmpA/MotB domain protein [Myxococcales bacterium]|nr:OmpA/MotB domain protein [Myxococcales bacterium]
MPRLALARSISVVAVLIGGVAHAQPAGNLELDGFRPAIDSRGYLTLNASEVLDHEELSFGLGSLEWGHHLLAFQNGAATYSVNNVISATLVAALGLRVGGVPFEVGASLPFTIMNGARGPDMIGDPANPNDDIRYPLDGQGLGDMGLHLKARLAHAGGFGLGAIASVYLPTANPRDRFLGDKQLTPQLMGVADAQLGRFRFAVNGGIRLRQTVSFTDTGDMGAPATMGTITASAELPLGIGAAWAVSREKLELVGEVFGAIPLGAHHGYQPLEALGGLKIYLAKSSYLSLGAGRGLLPNQAGNPDFRAFIGIVFEPKPEPIVHASIPDDVVAFAPPPKPDDSFHDRDNDGIADRDDKCPDDPENYNGIADWDGCPELAIDVGSKLVTLRSIEFEYDSAVIRPSSYDVLDAIVTALSDNPDISLVEVQGHTDERGNDDYNFDLSNRRAASVVVYLTGHGIAPARLTSQGYGETQPIDKSHTEAGWTKNRRVEFIIRTRS